MQYTDEQEVHTEVDADAVLKLTCSIPCSVLTNDTLLAPRHIWLRCDLWERK